MEEKIIANYNEILDKFEKIINGTENHELRDYIKIQYEDYIINLAKWERKDLEYYENKLRTIGTKEDKIVEILGKINEKIKIYVSNEDDLSYLSKPNEEKKVDSKNEIIEEYILNEVYRNKNSEISSGHEALIRQIRNEFKNPNDLSIKTWLKNYLFYVNTYKELNKDNLIDYAKLLFKELDKGSKYYNNFDKYVDEIEKEAAEVKKNSMDKSKKEENTNEVEPLKIINIKKNTIPNTAKKTFKVLGLVGVASTFGLPASILTFIIYKLYKTIKKSNNKLNDLIGKNGYFINEQDELVDKEGNVVTDEVIEKEKTSFLKTKLLNLKKTSNIGFIKDSYKKNKFASMILDTKLVSSLKKRFNIDVNTKVLEKKNNEQKDMHNGLGKC